MESTTQNRIRDFYDFITEFPLLGLYHEVGQELEKEIRSYACTEVHDQIWYRAKAPDGSRVFNKKDMLPPVPEDTREGRYNHYGLPCLYASENEETCASEIRREGESGVLCWIQKIRIDGARIIDLTSLDCSDGLIISGLLLTQAIVIHPSEKRRYYKPEYKITRFIADLCRLYKIDGIKYPSAVLKNNGSSGSNIVLFDTEGRLFAFMDEPYIYRS